MDWFDQEGDVDDSKQLVYTCGHVLDSGDVAMKLCPVCLTQQGSIHFAGELRAQSAPAGPSRLPQTAKCPGDGCQGCPDCRVLAPSSDVAGGPSRLRAQLQDAIQQLTVYHMEGVVDDTPFSYVLVRRHEVYQLIDALVGPAPVEKP